MGDPEPQDAARRVRAAHAYSKLTREALAAKLGISPSTLDLIEGKRTATRGPSWTELANVAAATGLPFEFFTADFERLPEIVPEGALTLVTKRGLKETRERLAQLERERARQARGHSGTPPASTGDLDARRKGR